jgi:hypothetical protein
MHTCLMRTCRMPFVHRLAMLLALIGCGAPLSFSQVFPPGTFSIDGIPVNCGMVATVMNPKLPDVGMNDLRGHITINPNIFNSQPTVLKLFWYAHECGHSNVGPSENAADCWAIETGKRQNWFPPEAFSTLEAAFANSPGDWTHLPGPARVQHIKEGYGLKADGDDTPEADDRSKTEKKHHNDEENPDPLDCGGAIVRVSRI